LLLFWTVTTYASGPVLEIVTPKKTVRLSLSELKAKLKTQTVEEDDVVYQKRMSFDGFLLNDVFALAGFGPTDAGDEIVFTAKDGYSPNMPFSAIKEHKAYLVYQQHGKHEKFDLIEQGKTKMSPGPFYLVWSEGKKLEGKVPMPYQLVKVEAVRFNEKYAKIFPNGTSEDSPEHRGFMLFKSECIRCHSINLQGGDVGPELNVPKSVTEYWRPDVLPKFIRNTGAFRYKSKMPSFEKYSGRQIEDVVSYLRFMAHHKMTTQN
jgi:mono/diheme cytochrome c family protein